MDTITRYIQYLRTNPNHYWFKRKLYGWGWIPATWQGWSVTALYVVLIIACAFTLDEHSSTREVIFTFVLPVVLFTIAFIRIAYRTGERPRWQWGFSDDTDNVNDK